MKKIVEKIIHFAICVSVFVSAFTATACKKKETTDYMYNGRYQMVEESDIKLVKDGTSDYSILLNQEYGPAEEYAALEFNRILNEAAGIELPVTTDADLSVSTKYISIGDTLMSEEANVKPTLEVYDRNGFHIKSYKDGLVINAPQKSGLIYGVYRFFEKNCDYMYYDVDTFKINRNKTVELKKFDFQDWPDFTNRDVFSYGMRTNAAHTMRLFNSGGQFSKWSEQYGEGSWWSQSLDDQSFITSLLKPKVYREKYPHWYVSSGKAGQAGYAQLCYTEGLYSEEELTYTKGMFEEEGFGDGKYGMFWTLVHNLIQEHIAVEPTKSVFLLGMSDNKTYCDCERCTRDVAIYEKSGVCLRFVNAIARVVEQWRQEECPERNIYLSVFAYLDLTIPPVNKENGKYVPIDESVIVEDNVLVRYAPAYDYYLFPLLDEEHNPGAYEALMGWSALTDKFAVWDYRAAFCDLISPFPNWLSEYANIKTYKAMGFVDVLSQSTSNFDGMPFLYMDNWVRSRLLWDTTLDYDALIYEFTENYYGPAGQYIRDYMDYLTNHYMTYMLDLGRMANPHYPEAINTNYYPRGVINNIENLFDKMYAAIQPYSTTDKDLYTKLKNHVDYESAFYRYCQIEFYGEFYVTEDLSNKIDEFERIQQKIGLTGLFAKTETFDGIIADWRKELKER